MNKKKFNFKIFFVGILFLAIIEIIIAAIIYLQMKPWQRIWWHNRINLFFTVHSNDYDKYLFTIPDSWISPKLKSSITPLNYIKSRNIEYLDHNIGEKGRLYWDSLMISNDLKSTTKEAIAFRENLFDNTETDELLLKLKAAIGFNPIRNSHFHSINDEIFDRNNLRIPVVFKDCASRNILIALPGSQSSPNAILGETNDYSNGFAKYWADRGFCVYALSVGPSPTSPLSFPRLGLSMMGADLAKIQDLSAALKIKHGDKSHIAIAGISYGARLAELSGILFSDINGIISIGGGARYDYLLSEFSHLGKQPHLAPNIWLEYFLSSAIHYRIILDLQKYLLISVGASDAGAWGESGQSKFFFLNDFINKSMSNKKFKYSLFYGTHESNPLEEAESYIKMLK
jgi:hypothetical protein